MEQSPEVIFFALHGTWLVLYNRNSLAENVAVSPEGNGPAGFSISHNVASEFEVDQMIESAIAVGATFYRPLQKLFWGGFSLLIHGIVGLLIWGMAKHSKKGPEEFSH